MDCIVVHYTLSLLYENYIPRESFQRICDFKGLKVLFIQDEYRRVNFVCERINRIGIDVIFSCAPSGVAKQIYRSVDKNTKILSTLTGYVPEDLISFSPIPLAELEKLMLDTEQESVLTFLAGRVMKNMRLVTVSLIGQERRL